MNGRQHKLLISVDIDLDLSDSGIADWAEEHTDTYSNGVYGVDDIGVYHMYMHSRTDLVTWINPRPCTSEVEGKSMDRDLNSFRNEQLSAAPEAAARKASCLECWSQKDYCEECSKINSLQ
jgi:hypothetical protein